MNLSHLASTDTGIDESIPSEMHLSDSYDINFSDDFSDTSSSRYTNGEIKPRTGDNHYYFITSIVYIAMFFHIASFLKNNMIRCLYITDIMFF